MAGSSVVARTGQMWKVVLGGAALLTGSFAPLLSTSGLSWTSGTVLAIVGYAFVCLAVRCPRCGSRWFWQAALDASVYGRVFRRAVCPACEHDYAAQTADRR